MILWHAGIGALLVYLTLGRRRVDYRFILVGAVVPDAVDAAAGAFLDYSGTGRGVAHSLSFVLVLAVAIVVTVRPRERRLAVFGLAVGWLTHLVADAMWQAPQTFLWPAFGPSFADAPGEPYSLDLVTQPTDHLWVWAGEVVGVLALGWLFVAHRLGHDDRLRAFLRDGYLRP